MKRRIVLLGLCIGLVIAGGWAYFNRQLLKDRYSVYQYPLQAQTAALLPNLELTDRGQFIYKASRPELLEAQNFNQACSNVAREHSIVLGCYTRQRVYIYNVKDARLNGVKEVTAAHELLHAMYERLPENEKVQLNQQLRTAAASIEDERFINTLNLYKKTEPDQVENELHSILGTEIAVLPSALEDHYKKYFTDRAQIVKYAQQYEATFTDIDNQIKTFDEKLTSLKQQKDQLEASLAAQQREIENEKARLDSLQANQQVEQFNEAVPGYNQRVRSYNDTITQLKAVINDYNDIVTKRNALASTQNDLIKQLDSSYRPIN